MSAEKTFEELHQKIQFLSESLDSEVGKLKVIHCQELDGLKNAFISDLNSLQTEFEIKWKEVQLIHEERIKTLEEQLNYLMEVHNCQRRMLEDNSSYIKKLEETKAALD